MRGPRITDMVGRVEVSSSLVNSQNMSLVAFVPVLCQASSPDLFGLLHCIRSLRVFLNILV